MRDLMRHGASTCYTNRDSHLARARPYRRVMSTFTLNNSVTIPTIGLGVFQSTPEDTSGAVASALEAGYRHIDTAASYGNEREVGQGLRASGLDRSEVFLETKLWISDYGYEQALHGVDKSADKLGVEQIDLLLLHQPLPSDLDRKS